MKSRPLPRGNFRHLVGCQLPPLARGKALVQRKPADGVPVQGVDARTVDAEHPLDLMIHALPEQDADRQPVGGEGGHFRRRKGRAVGKGDACGKAGLHLFRQRGVDDDGVGFVLLTDDGGFAHDILAPKRHVSKTYTVTIDTPLTEEMRAGFAAGVTLADGTALSPAEVSALTPDGLTVRVLLRQGVYHQIKRMFGIYGAGVNALHRDAIGGLTLDESLAPGQWRELTADEVAKITTG